MDPLLQAEAFSSDLISFIKYQVLDGLQKGSCTNNTFLLGPKYPIILPQEFWLPHYQMFRAANRKTFLITLKSKSILIRIFPTLTIKHRVLGSLFAGRGILIGFDLLHQIPSLRWSSKGLMHKQHLLTWTQVPHLFTVDRFDSLKL